MRDAARLGDELARSCLDDLSTDQRAHATGHHIRVLILVLVRVRRGREPARPNGVFDDREAAIGLATPQDEAVLEAREVGAVVGVAWGADGGVSFRSTWCDGFVRRVGS